MLKVQRFVNELMTSNCYVVYDEDTKRCLVIDPASEKSLKEIQLIEEKKLFLDYIIITHEHTDHNWGVNALRERFPEAKFVCSEQCNKYVKKTNRAYFLFYYDNPDYRYEIAVADILISRQEELLSWDNREISFFLTPGHSYGSMCIDVDGMLFTGDTIMPFKPYFNGRDSNEEDWRASIRRVLARYPLHALVFPGHGEQITLETWKDSNEIGNDKD